jgi:hypothetical protein
MSFAACGPGWFLFTPEGLQFVYQEVANFQVMESPPNALESVGSKQSTDINIGEEI